MAQQTAVEWLVNQVNSDCLTSTFIEPKFIEQAKQMEKDLILHTYWVAYYQGRYSGHKTAEEYYNETYNNESNNL